MPKEYGSHKYDSDGTSDCAYGCGCWMGPSRSGGPLGLDPGGACPMNPTDGNKLGGDRDYEAVVEARIEGLQRRAYRAEQALRHVDPDTLKMAERIAALEAELDDKKRRLSQIQLLSVSIEIPPTGS